MKNLLEFILNRLVLHPEDIEVIESEDERGFLYTLRVHTDDIARVIGRHGSVIQAIRSIAKVRAVKEGIHAHVVIENE